MRWSLTVIIGAICVGSSSGLGAASQTDPTPAWPKNSQFNCSGILVQEEGIFQLKPDQGMLPWCGADIEDKDKGRVLAVCKVGSRCEIKGVINGHGAFSWVKITSVRSL